MTELATYTDPGALEPHTPPSATHNGLAALASWVSVAREVYPLADSLSKTSFVPKALRDKPYEVMATILAGSEVGMQPMASLRSIDNVEGKPSFSAIALRALVQSHGHDIWVVESNDTRAVVHGRRRGSDHIEKSTWTLDMAKKAGLAGKTNWQRYPGPMLEARATGVVARRIDADGIAGMPYSTEELLDGVGLEDVTPAEADALPAGVRRMSRRKPDPEPETVRLDGRQIGRVAPPAAPEPEPVAEPVGTEQGISAPQMKALQAGFKAIGVTDRTERLRRASALTGREIGSANDLTRTEAGTILDYLDKAQVPDQGEENQDQDALAIFDDPGYEPPVEDQ